MSIEVKALKYVDFNDFADEIHKRIDYKFVEVEYSFFYLDTVIAGLCLGKEYTNYSYCYLHFDDVEEEMSDWRESDVVRNFGKDVPFTLEQVKGIYNDAILPLAKELGFEDGISFWVCW